MKVRHWLAKSQLLFTCAALTLACGGGGIMAEPNDGDNDGSGSSSNDDSNSSSLRNSDSNDTAASTNASDSTNSGDAAGDTTNTGDDNTGDGSTGTNADGGDDPTTADNSDNADNSNTGTDPDDIDDGDTTSSIDDPNVTATTDPSVPSIIDPNYPGVDVALVPEQAPTGCAGGLDLETGSLELTLDADVRGLLLSESNGALLVNGEPCTAADGTEVNADNLMQLSIIGNEDHNFVIFDFMPGAWDGLLEEPGSVHLELDSGRNQLVFRGTAGDDSIYLGTVGTDTGLDWTGDGHANVIAVDVDNIIVSVGPGDDNLGSMLDLEPTPLEDDEEEPLVVDRLDVRVSAWGGEGNDQLAGGNGNDWFNGGAGNDVLSGYDGTDTFADGADLEGADVINGGAGFDEISYETRAANLNISLCRTEGERGCDETCSCEADDGEVGEGDNLINLEMVTGGTGNDVMIGTESDESFFGNEGNDRLVGNTGSDLLLGQQGNDELDGGPDEDICDNDPADISTLDCEI